MYRTETLQTKPSWCSSNESSPLNSPKKVIRKASSSSTVVPTSSSQNQESDEIILFSGQNVRLVQFSTFRKHTDYDTPPDRSNRVREQLVAKGQLQVYKMLGKKAAFVRCGLFVHPILPRLRTWRTSVYEFIMPQPLPGKYWRIELPVDIGSGPAEMLPATLEQVFDDTCFYKNMVPPPTPPDSEDEGEVKQSSEDGEYSSSASTLDRILDTFHVDQPDDEVTLLAGPGSECESDSNVNSHSEDESESESESESQYKGECESISEVQSQCLSEPESEATTAATNDTHTNPNPSSTITELVPPSTNNDSYINHPLVPLATRNNILSSTFPLRFKPMDDDWLDISGNPIPSYHYPRNQSSNHPPGYVSWASQVTNDLVSSSSNYISDKMNRMTLYSSTAYVPRIGSPAGHHPQSYWNKEYYEALNRHPSEVISLRKEPQHIEPPPDFYHQAVTVSGYVGWRIWNKMSPWARRGA